MANRYPQTKAANTLEKIAKDYRKLVYLYRDMEKSIQDIKDDRDAWKAESERGHLELRELRKQVTQLRIKR